MVDVPNLSVLPTPKEKVMTREKVPPRNRLGLLIRDWRVQNMMPLRDVADKLAEDLGVPVSAVTLGQIERGVRPVASAELEALSRVLGIPMEKLHEQARQWNQAVWEEPGEPVQLTPEGTQSSTVFTMSPYELWDELCAVVADLDRGVEALKMAMHVLDQSSVVAANARLTSALLQASSRRLKGRMSLEKVQVTCTSDEEAPSSTYPQF